MKPWTLAWCAAALIAGNAHAATYVVPAKALNFSPARQDRRRRRTGEGALRHGAADLGPRGIDEFFGKGRVNADDSLR